MQDFLKYMFVFTSHDVDALLLLLQGQFYHGSNIEKNTFSFLLKLQTLVKVEI